MNRSQLEPDVLECVERIERAVETMYLEYHYDQSRDIMNSNFTYRVELDKNGEDKQPRIRLRSGSTTNRKTYYAGTLIPALKALVFLRSVLCERALVDLQRLSSYEKFHSWFSKEPIDISMPTTHTPELIMLKIIEHCRKIRPQSSPYPSDIDDLSGFFIEEVGNDFLTYQRLESSVDLLDETDLDERLQNALIKILPESSSCSFCITKVNGRYWLGDFTRDPYRFYIDMGWVDGQYLLRFLNIAGFPRKKTIQPIQPTLFPQENFLPKGN